MYNTDDEAAQQRAAAFQAMDDYYQSSLKTNKPPELFAAQAVSLDCH